MVKALAVKVTKINQNDGGCMENQPWCSIIMDASEMNQHATVEPSVEMLKVHQTWGVSTYVLISSHLLLCWLYQGSGPQIRQRRSFWRRGSFLCAPTSLEAHSETRADKTSHRVENVFANKTEQRQRTEAENALLHHFSFHSSLVAHVPTSLFHSLSIYPSVSSLSLAIHSSPVRIPKAEFIRGPPTLYGRVDGQACVCVFGGAD